MSQYTNPLISFSQDCNKCVFKFYDKESLKCFLQYTKNKSNYSLKKNKTIIVNEFTHKELDELQNWKKKYNKD